MLCRPPPTPAYLLRVCKEPTLTLALALIQPLYYTYIPYIYTLQEELEDGEDIARCDSCTLIMRVVYDEVRYPHSCTPTMHGVHDEEVVAVQ